LTEATAQQTAQALIAQHEALGTSHAKWEAAEAAAKTKNPAYFVPYTEHYKLGANNFVAEEMDEDMQEELGPIMLLHGIDVRTEKVQKFSPLSKVGSPTAPVFEAYYMPGAIAMETAYKVNDKNPTASQITPSELIFQGLVQTKTVPKVIAMYQITNVDTVGFVKKALAAAPKVGGGVATRTTVKPNDATKGFFEAILGSENGRGVQYVLNSHPTYFGGKTVTEIEIETTQPGLTRLFFTIG